MMKTCSKHCVATATFLIVLFGVPLFALSVDFSSTGTEKQKNNLAAKTINHSEELLIALSGKDAGTDIESQEEDDYENGDEENIESVADPIILWNTVWYHFNDKFYFWLLKPVAKGYRDVVAVELRIVVSNFFKNLTTPIRFLNCVLQGRLDGAGHELGRFVINTTLGVFGMGDVASEITDLKPQDEDFGQTLGTYGIGNGFYIVWPFIGPSSARDTLGLVGDYFLNPTSYLEDYGTWLAVKSTEVVNETSFSIGDYETLKEAAFDPYVSIRDAYIQHRNKKVKE